LKLQKVAAYTYRNKLHHKYIITIPEETIQQLNWEEGSELKHEIKDNSLVITFLSIPIKEQRKISEPKMSYEEFKDNIKTTLQYNDNGMTWTELKNELKLEQVVPNNKWVRQMEKDIGLIRLKDIRGIVWRLRHVQ
jgi:hypothetical protein